MESKKEIRYDSPEAAQFKTGISGWVSSDGRFFGKDENLARYAGCTHKKCDSCDNYANKGWIYCEDCRRKRAAERWEALPHQYWDGKTAICTWDGDKYFFDEGELMDWLDENELNGSDVHLVFCESIEYRQIEYGYWGEDAHEDWEPPKKLVEAVERLNKVIRELKPHTYTAGSAPHMITRRMKPRFNNP